MSEVYMKDLPQIDTITDTTAIVTENTEKTGYSEMSDVKEYMNGSETLNTTAQTTNSAINELKTAIDIIRADFLGDRTFKVAFGKIINTVLTSTTCYMPFKASEVNVTLTGINIPGLGNVEIDYKGAVVSDYGFFIQCTTAGALGMSTLESQVATVAVSITAK